METIGPVLYVGGIVLAVLLLYWAWYDWNKAQGGTKNQRQKRYIAVVKSDERKKQ